jgi:flagellar basal-body rod modification protein FlgD
VSKDEFLKLLTNQLKNQDPLNPYDNQQFAAQLAQFSQLEQLIDIRGLMQDQSSNFSSLAQSISNSALPGLLGKYAKSYSNKINFDGEAAITAGYTMPYQGVNGDIQIKNASGAVVRTIEISNDALSLGEHQFKWDGKDSEGNLLAKGEYTFEVTATDSRGSSINADPFSYGKIQGVRFKNDGTKLLVNGVEISLENVYDIANDL